MKLKSLLLFSLLLLSMAFMVMAQGDKAAPPMLTPADLKWGAAPPALPAGAELTVLYGDPGKEGAPYVLRLKAPAGYKIPPHFHPTDENVTVLSGTFNVGMGDTLDPKASKPFPPGSFVQAPANMHHYAWCKGPCVVQVHGMGPFAITYVNAADDPRNATKSK
jgi:quercetin dioxygenase-like cupin family protein